MFSNALKRKKRTLAVIQSALTSVLFVISTDIATAEVSAVCQRLEARLQNTTSNSSTSKSRYNKAIHIQKQQIAKGYAKLQSIGCRKGSVIIVNGRSASKCKKLTKIITKMQSNLRKYEHRINRLKRTTTNTSASKIQAALQANNCNASSKRVKITKASVSTHKRTTKKSGNSIITRRLKSRKDTPANTQASRRLLLLKPKRGGGGLRTMCVRSCDGFYFPISYNASRSDLERDESACQLMCPGTNAALYIHSTYGQESEDMRSARTGKKYLDLPQAFAYRTKTDKSCSCNMKAFYSAMTKRENLLVNTQKGTTSAPTFWVRPNIKPEHGEDPETNANRVGGATDEIYKRLVNSSQINHEVSKSGQPVRVVGPIFFPDQEAVIDLKSPGQSVLQ